MKINKRVLIPLLALCLIMNLSVPVLAAAWPEAPEEYAGSAIVMDADSGTILYEKNSNEQLYPASITKIMTVLLALEKGNLDDVVTFSKNSVFDIELGSSIVGGINEGDQFTLEECMYGAMICSGNETSYAIAEFIGGDLKNFAAMMNERAKELGCLNTNFTNPHGLNDSEHYTSAYDMALISKEALKNEEFRKIASTVLYTFPPTKDEEERIRPNHHKMLPGISRKYEYEGCTGGKTGYTVDAASTLVTFAQRDGVTLICVVMKEKAPQHWDDTAKLLDYGFDNFEKLNIVENIEKNQSASELIATINSLLGDNALDSKTDVEQFMLGLKETDIVTVPKGVKFSDLKYEIVSTPNDSGIHVQINYSYDNHAAGTTELELIAGKNEEVVVEKTEPEKTKFSWEKITVPIKKFFGGILWIFIMLGILLTIAAIFLLPPIWKDYQRTKKRKQVMEQHRKRRNIPETQIQDSEEYTIEDIITKAKQSEAVELQKMDEKESLKPRWKETKLLFHDDEDEAEIDSWENESEEEFLNFTKEERGKAVEKE